MAKPTLKRSSGGMTLIELVVSALLMGLAMAPIGELVYLNTYASTKLTNKVDGQVGASRAIRESVAASTLLKWAHMRERIRWSISSQVAA